MHIGQRVFAPTRISLMQFPILSFSQSLTITDSIDYIITCLMESRYVIKGN